MTLEFKIKAVWDDEGVDIIINGNMVGRIPKGVERAVIRAIYDGAPAGMDLFSFVVKKIDFENRVLAVGFRDGELEIGRYEIIEG